MSWTCKKEIDFVLFLSHYFFSFLSQSLNSMRNDAKLIKVQIRQKQKNNSRL